MKQTFKLFAIFALAVTASSCVKEGHICYRFEIYNNTGMPMTVSLSSWGGYTMSINGMYDSSYKFHEVEVIKPYSSLMFSKTVGGDPAPYGIPPSLTPAWEYITAIDCNGVAIPKEYFANRENWETNVAWQINGTFMHIVLKAYCLD